MNEVGSNLCVVGGQDMGPLLAHLFASAWFILLTLPLGGLLLLVWFILRLRAAPDPDPTEGGR